jgi:hypothetical protein
MASDDSELRHCALSTPSDTLCYNPCQICLLSIQACLGYLPAQKQTLTPHCVPCLVRIPYPAVWLWYSDCLISPPHQLQPRCSVSPVCVLGDISAIPSGCVTLPHSCLTRSCTMFLKSPSLLNSCVIYECHLPLF